MKKPITLEPIFWTRQQVCEKLNCSKSAYYAEVEARRLRIIPTCGGPRVHIDDLRDYIQRILAGNREPAYSEDDPCVRRSRTRSAVRKTAANARKTSPRKDRASTKCSSSASAADPHSSSPKEPGEAAEL